MKKAAPPGLRFAHGCDRIVIYRAKTWQMWKNTDNTGKIPTYQRRMRTNADKGGERRAALCGCNERWIGARAVQPTGVYGVCLPGAAFRLSRPPCAQPLHDDFEFVCINAGRMRYTVNGEGYVLRAGDGLFVNSCQAHACESCEGEDCEYFCMVLHPSLLARNAYLRENFVRPLSRNDAFACLPLRGTTLWQRGVLRCVREACALLEGDDPAAELSVMSQAFPGRGAAHAAHARAQGAGCGNGQALAGPAAHAGPCAGALSGEDIPGRSRCGGAACRSAPAANCFAGTRDRRPGGYVTRYRLERGMEQLRNPNLSVAEIARSVGFASASYFSECFKRYLHTTPLGYRRGAAEGERRGA